MMHVTLKDTRNSLEKSPGNFESIVRTPSLLLADKMLKISIADLISTARELANYSKPPEQDFLSVESYFDGRRPVCNPESYIYFKEDLITLKPGRGEVWLDFLLWAVLRRIFCNLTRV
jgi:hypothetical protein